MSITNGEKSLDDELIPPHVGLWAEKKYRLIHNYSRIFSTSMKKKWDARVYIDLFAGAGISVIQGTSRKVLTSPMLSLDIRDKFDKYIFCELDKVKLDALQHRVEKRYSNTVDVQYIHGDANLITEKILESIPTFRKGFKVISFCFLDPLKAKNLSFSTIEALSITYVDFLILVPIYMDMNRTKNIDNKIIEKFVGSPDWRDQWKAAKEKNIAFDIFFTEYYQKRMESLGYCHGGYSEIVRSTNKNLPLYRLGFFSRHPLGQKFWEEAKKYSTDQTNLFD